MRFRRKNNHETNLSTRTNYKARHSYKILLQITLGQHKMIPWHRKLEATDSLFLFPAIQNNIKKRATKYMHFNVILEDSRL